MLETSALGYQAGRVWLLQGVSVRVAPRQFWAVLGPNGAGKSTLAKLLAGELRPSMGTLAINGLPLHKTRGRELAKQRAFLPQHSQLAFDYRVAQVVEMGVYPYSTAELGQPSASLVSQCLAQVGLESYGSRSYLSLSGGEQQRTHLARVLAQLTASGCPKGKLLILDEPTSSLDPRHQLYTLSLARKMADEGAGVIAVLHDAALAARFATHFLLLKGGVTITQGTFKEAFATEALSLLYDMPCRMVPDGLGGVCVRFG